MQFSCEQQERFGRSNFPVDAAFFFVVVDAGKLHAELCPEDVVLLCTQALIDGHVCECILVCSVV